MRVSAALLFAAGAYGQIALICESPEEKYFSVDLPHGFCGEVCMNPKDYKLYKKFEANLTKAWGPTQTDRPCLTQTTPTGKAFTEYSETVTHGVPGLSITLDLWNPAGAQDHSCCKTSKHPTCTGVWGHTAGPFTVEGMGPFCCPSGSTQDSTCPANTWQSMVDHVNLNAYGWTAELPARFGSLDDVKETLGAFLPGDPEYEELPALTVRVESTSVPSSFDSADNWPACSVISNVRDQSTCGSCWAFASTESFESRRCVATGEDIKFSTEDTAFCQPRRGSAGNGCNGGNTAWNFFVKSGVVTGGDYSDAEPTAGCLPYSFAPCAHHVPATADYPACGDEGGSPKCLSECSESSFGSTYYTDKHFAATAYSVKTPAAMQSDIQTNGPLYVAFSVFADFPLYKSGVYQRNSESGSYLGGHAVLAVGWGTLNGTPYWRIKNSWNEEWGDAGHFKILRGSNECGIERSASGGTVVASTVV